MKLFEILKYFNKHSEESKNAKKITDTLPLNDVIAKEILKDLGNNTTKVVLDEDIKNSYYVYLQDTIYISNKEKNKGVHRCCLVAHECIHSMQSKLIQKINFILSNLELLFFIVALIFAFTAKLPVIAYVYLTICFISLTPRIYLELNAIFNSVKLSKKYLSKKLENQDCEKIIDIYKSQINLLLPFSFFSLFFGKIIRVLIILIVTFLI